LQASRSSSQTFDPIISINSGQTFLWENLDGEWYGIDGQHIHKVSVRKSGPIFSSFPRQEGWERDYFRMDDDIDSIFAGLKQDAVVAGLVNSYTGLRLLRQDPWQCLISFICASNSNIATIRHMLRSLSRKFGTKSVCDGNSFFTFPSPAKIARASEGELLACSLGYRVKAVKGAAAQVASGELNLDGVKKLDYSSAKEELAKIYGIGNKISDCVLLFSLEKTEAFPIDVWIARALAKHYSAKLDRPIKDKLTPKQYEEISEQMRRHFGKFAGYAQQYLYYDIRQRAGLSW
jgi:N-glycosylase/DNA lyase